MDEETARIEHLKVIQAVVDRMARSAFAIKAGSITITAALVAVTLNTTYAVAALGILPILMLWMLDAFFLRQERAFRVLYDKVRREAPSGFGTEDYFSMAAEPDQAFWNRLNQTWGAMRATTMLLFYLTIVGFLVLVAILKGLSL